MLKSVTNHMYCQEDALSGVTIGGTDKELQKSSCQSKLNVAVDENHIQSTMM